MKLIVGLGNPGKQYISTRHNAGFQWVFKLADKLQVTLRKEVKFHGLCARIGQGDNELWLLCPQTYMNVSGKAVSTLCNFYKINPDQILVVHDELDFSIPRTDAGREAAAEIKHIMETCYELTVPLIADMEIGTNWGNVE